MTAPLLTAREVGDMLGVSTETVLRWVQAGQFPGYRLPGGAFRFRREVVESLAASREAREARAPRRPPPADYAAVLADDPCSYCGRPSEQIDHINPVARGGGGDWTNCTAACMACNTAKWAHPLLLWLARRGAISMASR